MLIAPTPLSRQSPVHASNLYQAVSLSNGRWFNNSSNNSASYIVASRVNGTHGIKVLTEDDVKPFLNNSSRTMPCDLNTPPRPISPLSSSDVKEQPAYLLSISSPKASPETIKSDVSSSPCQLNRKLNNEEITRHQQNLETRAIVTLKRLASLRSTHARKALCTNLSVLLEPRSRILDFHEELEKGRSGRVPGDEAIAKASESSNFDSSPELRREAGSHLRQLIFDIGQALPDLLRCDSDATDIEDDDDSYFHFKDANSITANAGTSPVLLPVSRNNVLEETYAWRYEQERLSLAARDSFLRLQIKELDSKIHNLSHRNVKRGLSSQIDSFQQACSSARTRPYTDSVSRKRTVFRLAELSSHQNRGNQPKSPLSPSVMRLSCCNSLPFNPKSSLIGDCHCSCRSLVQNPSSPVSPSSISCISCEGQRLKDVIVASQPDIDPETRLTLIDPTFHPKISKLSSEGDNSVVTYFDRVDNAASCLLDHAYSADPIMSKPKTFRKSSSPLANKEMNSTKTVNKQMASPRAVMPISLPQIPLLNSHPLKSSKLPNAFFVNPGTLEKASRPRGLKQSTNSTPLNLGENLDSDNLLKNKKKIVMQQTRRFEQRNRLQLQRRKEQQRRKQLDKSAKLIAPSSRRSSAQSPHIGASNRPSAVQTNPPLSGAMLSHSAPAGIISTSTPIGSGGFDIDNVVIPPPTPTALLAAAQALAESCALEIATPGFRRIPIESFKPTQHRTKQLRLSAAPASQQSLAVSISVSGPDSSLSSNTSDEPASCSSSSRLPSTASSETVFPVTPVLTPPVHVVMEDIDDIDFRRRHLPLEHKERTRYLQHLQSTIAPRKIRDMAVSARPPNNLGKSSKGLSKSCTEEGLRRSSRVLTATSSAQVTDPECAPFVFPLTELEWKAICAEKDALAQLEHD